ncbi:MAG: hypothetical protein HQM16_18305, partial [Deltaproteobacteria bacterium]|nr:hypothetical protein [Deltaproteobacteria bacterium]
INGQLTTERLLQIANISHNTLGDNMYCYEDIECSGSSWAGSPADNDADGTPNCHDVETCDNLDNDGDGVTDEGLTRESSCGVGACQGNTGTETCVAGVWGSNTCNAYNGASAETCDDIDNDCDGTKDEELTRPTTCGLGACDGNTGTETCTAGAWGSNTCNAYNGASAETCDIIDNDCDGAVDDNLSRPTTCGIGACANNTGIETCTTGSWGGDTCNPLNGAAASDTTCDAIDDDCDGVLNEDYVSLPTTCGVGACAATGATSCASGVEVDDCTLGTPVAEICDDDLDNNCDGVTDEHCPTIITITLKTGKNWISLPFDLIDESIDEPDAAVKNLAIVLKSLNTADPALDYLMYTRDPSGALLRNGKHVPARLKTLTSMVPLRNYVIDITGDHTLVIRGFGLETEQLTLSAGENWVGFGLYNFGSDNPIAEALGAMTGSYDLYHFDATSGLTRYGNKEGEPVNSLDRINPGAGYIFEVLDWQTWEPPATTP